MDKNAIKKFAVWARVELIERVAQKAAEYGIEEKNIVPGSADSVNGRVLTADEKKQRQGLIQKIQQDGYEQVMEEAAYTWFNRFCALRFMEVNNYLPSRVRVFTDEENHLNPQILTEAIHMDLPGLDLDRVYAYKEANQEEELYKYLLITQCNALSEILPRMFERISDYTELLLPDHLLRQGSVIEQMITLIPEEDWRDAVQIIGWLYQYYISDKHDEIVNINKAVIMEKDIPAATQLFTTDWVVRYMVDNSVGRYWIERNPDSHLADKLEFFVKPKKDEIHYVTEKIEPQDVTVFDPCMGSGHILAYAFDVLMEIYREYGYTDREAVAGIINHNLHGFDIDKRCAQLAYFVVMMKARQYDSRFLKRNLQPQIYYSVAERDLHMYGSMLQIENLGEAPVEPETFSMFSPSYAEFEVKLNDWNVRKLLHQKYAAVCTNPPYLNKYNDELKKFVQGSYKDYSGDLFSVFMYRNFGLCKENGYSAFMTPFVWMFIQTYEKLREFIIKNKTITTLVQMEYSAFEEATVPICAFVLKNGMPENFSLCFRLSEFKGGMAIQEQKIREALINPDCGYFYEINQSEFIKIPGAPIAYWASPNIFNAFLTERVSSVAFSDGQILTGDNNKYLRMLWEVPATEIRKDGKWMLHAKGGEYRKWSGNLEWVVKWSPEAIEHYKSDKIARFPKDYILYRKGVTWSLVSTNPTFGARLLHSTETFNKAAASILFQDEKYILYTLGLVNSSVVNYLSKIINPTLNNNIKDILAMPFIFDENKSSKCNYLVSDSIRLSEEDWDSFETSWNFLNDSLVKNSDSLWDCTAIAATMSHYYYGRLPEASCPMEICYLLWKGECEDRFQHLKANEEELNRIFIDIYGLQDELIPEVEDKDVTVYRIFDTKNDIPESMGSSRYALTKQDVVKNFISYAVGCMFGRYTLDKQGLVYAGGDFNETYRKDRLLPGITIGGDNISLGGNYTYVKDGDHWKELSFPVDADNIIPISDDEYFTDDIVSRFEKFVSTVYGEDTLAENMKFIANALGGKGQPRDVIRNYFLNDFYKDHCRMYQKRPIYWLFDSGKKNGFKALIYMHRYQPDTIARIRTDYVHEQQDRYRNAIPALQEQIDSASASSRVKLQKSLQKLKDQEAELRTYEEKIHHLADQMISIDLDDGVKHNYEIFADVLAKIK